MNTIGNRIRSRRLELGLTQTELASKLGYTNKSSIGKIENGNNTVPYKKIAEFADALDTNVSYLMGLDDNPALMQISKKAVFKAQIDPIINELNDVSEQKLLSYAEFLLNSQQ